MKPELSVIKGGKDALHDRGRRLLFRGICLGDEQALREARETVYPRLSRRATLSLAASRSEPGRCE